MEGGSDPGRLLRGNLHVPSLSPCPRCSPTTPSVLPGMRCSPRRIRSIKLMTTLLPATREQPYSHLRFGNLSLHATPKAEKIGAVPISNYSKFLGFLTHVSPFPPSASPYEGTSESSKVVTNNALDYFASVTDLTWARYWARYKGPRSANAADRAVAARRGVVSSPGQASSATFDRVEDDNANNGLDRAESRGYKRS